MPIGVLARAALLLLLALAGCQGASSSPSSSTGTPAAVSPGNASPLPPGTVGVLYSQTFTVLSGGGAPYGMTIANAPPGLVLIPSGVAFVLSGTPTSPGTFSPQLHVVDATSFATNIAYQLTIQPAPTQIPVSPSSLANATANAPYTQTLTALAGVPPYTWTVGTGALPPGYVLGPGPNATTTISGVTPFSGTFVFTIIVVDGSTPPLKGAPFYGLSVH